MRMRTHTHTHATRGHALYNVLLAGRDLSVRHARCADAADAADAPPQIWSECFREIKTGGCIADAPSPMLDGLRANASGGGVLRG